MAIGIRCFASCAGFRRLARSSGTRRWPLAESCGERWSSNVVAQAVGGRCQTSNSGWFQHDLAILGLAGDREIPLPPTRVNPIPFTVLEYTIPCPACPRPVDRLQHARLAAAVRPDENRQGSSSIGWSRMFLKFWISTDSIIDGSFERRDLPRTGKTDGTAGVVPATGHRDQAGSVSAPHSILPSSPPARAGRRRNEHPDDGRSLVPSASSSVRVFRTPGTPERISLRPAQPTEGRNTLANIRFPGSGRSHLARGVHYHSGVGTGHHNEWACPQHTFTRNTKSPFTHR